jgi:hypothetical protein
MTEAATTPAQGELRNHASREVWLDARDFLEACRAVRQFVSKEKHTREYLCGASLEWSRDDVRLTATNGHTLLSVRLADEPPEGEHVSAIVSTAGLKHAAKWLRENKGPSLVRVQVNAWDEYGCGRWHARRGVKLYLGQAAEASLETVYGVFPDWRRVVPMIHRENQSNVRFDPCDWRRALAVLRGQYEPRAVFVAWNALGVKLDDGSEDAEPIPGTWAEWGASHREGADPRLLGTILDTFKGARNLSLCAGRYAGEPMRFVSDSHSGWICVLMPMRI